MNFIIGILSSIFIIAFSGLAPDALNHPVTEESFNLEVSDSQRIKTPDLDLSINKIEVWREEYPEYEVRIN